MWQTWDAQWLHDSPLNDPVVSNYCLFSVISCCVHLSFPVRQGVRLTSRRYWWFNVDRACSSDRRRVFYPALFEFLYHPLCPMRLLAKPSRLYRWREHHHSCGSAFVKNLSPHVMKFHNKAISRRRKWNPLLIGTFELRLIDIFQILFDSVT